MIARRGWLALRLNRWASKRHGVQTTPVTLSSNRIYILPTRSGIVFSVMLLIMLLGSMNYNNSMGLGLSFLLGSIMLVAMHHCHRNLLGLQISYHAPEPVFAGQDASIDVTLHNANQHSRSDLVLQVDNSLAPAINVPSQHSEIMTLGVPTQSRGYQSISRLSVRTRYPGGLFRAWTWVYWDLKVLVYPQPFGSQALPAHGSGQDAGNTVRTRGEEELAELRNYQRGDPLNRVAWKHFARSGELHSKTFDDPASVDLWLDWRMVEATDVEARLAQLSAWVVHTHERQISYGLRLPTVTLNPDHSSEHRARCLKELAVYA